MSEGQSSALLLAPTSSITAAAGNRPLPVSIFTPLVIVTGGGIVKDRESISVIIDLDVVDVAVHKADLIEGIVVNRVELWRPIGRVVYQHISRLWLME